MEPVKTGICGLDFALGDGFDRPSVVLICGVAGTGKTTLCTHIGFNLARAGLKVLYVSTLSEPKGMVLRYISRFKFFNSSLVESKRVSIKQLRMEELRDIDIFENSLKMEIEKTKPDVLIIDPFTPIITPLEKRNRIRLFDFYNMVKGWNLLTFLTHEIPREIGAEDVNTYLADCVLHIYHQKEGQERSLYMEIVKARGHSHLKRPIYFEINSNGVALYPIDKILRAVMRPVRRKNVIKTDLKSIDLLLGGGIRDSSLTIISGPSGIGKEVLVFNLIDALLKHKKGVLIASIAIDEDTIRGYSRLIKPGKNMIFMRFAKIDEIISPRNIHTIYRHLSRKNIGIFYGDFIPHLALQTDINKCLEYLLILRLIMKSHGVCGIFTSPERIISYEGQDLTPFLHKFMDNIINMRFVELEGRIERGIYAVKSMVGTPSADIKRFEIQNGRIVVLETFDGVELILSGTPIRSTGKEALEKAISVLRVKRSEK